MNTTLKPMNYEPIQMKEPDWKAMYFGLALRVMAGDAANKCGDKDATCRMMDAAARMVERHEKGIELAQTVMWQVKESA